MDLSECEEMKYILNFKYYFQRHLVNINSTMCAIRLSLCIKLVGGCKLDQREREGSGSRQWINLLRGIYIERVSNIYRAIIPQILMTSMLIVFRTSVVCDGHFDNCTICATKFLL